MDDKQKRIEELERALQEQKDRAGLYLKWYEDELAISLAATKQQMICKEALDGSIKESLYYATLAGERFKAQDVLQEVHYELENGRRWGSGDFPAYAERALEKSSKFLADSKLRERTASKAYTFDLLYSKRVKAAIAIIERMEEDCGCSMHESTCHMDVISDIHDVLTGKKEG